ALCSEGAGASIVKQRELARMPALLNRFTEEPVGLAVGLSLLVRIFQDAHYRHLDGRMLEGIARLFADNVKVYAYPMAVADLEEQLRLLSAKDWMMERTGAWVSLEQLRPPPPLCHLHDYLISSGFIVPMRPQTG